ncbi:oligopeptide:H+ symporter [Actinotignum urinale]|uniref:peptide MFS transporter n=1 Tax=Actinotignum urinale TaxID=190146 RepID=UPI002A82C81C|nr:oligopeptide:H+ symporter [Actinotignum urinale]MDY5128889.1 oligopeptide:H+ symporter [Actinotignum urinale]
MNIDADRVASTSLTPAQLNIIAKEKRKDELAQSSTSFLGQPKGLFALFNLEIWERFSYLGFQAILALYFSASVINGGLGYEKTTASSIVAAYGALLYLLSIAGAWIADRIIGTHKAVLWGAIIIATGHIFMGLPLGEIATWAGLGFIIVGTGLLKPNVSTKVGELYSQEDTRRDAGFAIYYAGINIGCFLGPLVAGYLGQNINWHAGFGAAAVGMILGIILYIIQYKDLGGNESSARIRMLFTPDKHFWMVVGLAGAVILLAVIFGGTGIVAIDGFINAITGLTIAVPILYLVWMYRSPLVTPHERRNLFPYSFLLIALVMYNLTYFQTGNTLNFLALDHTHNEIAGFTYPSTWYISLTAIVEIIMGPLLAWLWIKLGKRQPHVAAKVGIGTIFGGVAFLLVTLGGTATPNGAKMSALWMLGCYIFLGLGDLVLQTAGMSATTRLAPRAFASQTMAVWLASMAMAQGVQAQVVKFYNYDNLIPYFGIQAAVIIGYGVLLILMTPWMRKRMTAISN